MNFETNRTRLRWSRDAWWSTLEAMWTPCIARTGVAHPMTTFQIISKECVMSVSTLNQSLSRTMRPTFSQTLTVQQLTPFNRVTSRTDEKGEKIVEHLKTPVVQGTFLPTTGLLIFSTIRSPLSSTTLSNGTIPCFQINLCPGWYCRLRVLTYGLLPLHRAYSYTISAEDMVRNVLSTNFHKCFRKQRTRSSDPSESMWCIGILTKSWSRKLEVYFKRGRMRYVPLN